MKDRLIAFGLMVVLVGGILAGCGKKDDDGPQMSDDDLLKRGSAGHDAAGGKSGYKPPAGVPGSPE